MRAKDHIQKDPTLKFFIEQPIDYKFFDWQIKLKCFAIMESIRRSINNY